MTDNKMTPEQMEMWIVDLKDRLESIKRVTPYSFKSLTEEDRRERYCLASCKCGWWGSSALLEGGGAIADTGDHFDCTCPFCGSADIGEMNDPYREVWDQACREQKEANAPLSIYTCLDDIEYEKRIKGFVARYGGGRKLTESDLQQFAFSLIQPIYEAIYDSIITAPAPEFKLTDKE